MLLFWIRVAIILIALILMFYFLYRTWVPKLPDHLLEERDDLREYLKEIHGEISNKQLERLVIKEEKRLKSLKKTQ